VALIVSLRVRKLSQLRFDGRPAGEGLPGQILPTGLHGLFGLGVELVGLCLQLLPLHLQPLAGGGDVEQAPLHLLKHLELLLVGVVQRLARILHLVDGLGGLGLEDHREPLPQTHGPPG
jgi:hypothetical protein